MIRGVVEPITHWENDILYAHNTGDVFRPAILKLTHSNTRPARIPTFRRTVVFARDDWECQYCGKHVSHRDATIDHIIPDSRGGPTSWRNCTTACRSCNRFKDDRTPAEAGMTLRNQPKSPTLAHLWNVKSGGTEWHESWADFLPR